MSALVGGLGVNGTMWSVERRWIQSKFCPISSFSVKSIKGLGGWHPHRLAGHPPVRGNDGWRPMIEKYPLAKAAEGYARMMSGNAEFRVVLTM